MFTSRETHGRISRSSAGLWMAAAVLFTSATVAPEAVARPVDRGTFHDEGTEVVNDFCGQAGLTVTIHFVVDGRFLVNARKPGTPVYGLQMIRVTETITNEAGESATSVVGTSERDLKITDN